MSLVVFLAQLATEANAIKMPWVSWVVGRTGLVCIVFRALRFYSWGVGYRVSLPVLAMTNGKIHSSVFQENPAGARALSPFPLALFFDLVQCQTGQVFSGPRQGLTLGAWPLYAPLSHRSLEHQLALGPPVCV